MTIVIGSGRFEVDLEATGSDDPLAFAYGFVEALSGRPKARGDLASEYERGYAQGRDILTRRKPLPAWCTGTVPAFDPAKDAAKNAAREAVDALGAAHRPWVPLSVADLDEPAFPSFVGKGDPKGWEVVERLFVDASGFGQDDEPALTQTAFRSWIAKHLDKGYGYAVTGAGRFQVWVTAYEKHGR